MGRPSTYRERYAAAAALLARIGATDAQLADFFGIRFSTLQSWYCRHKTFRDAVYDGREALKPLIERSLAMKAIGYTWDSEKVFYNSGQDKVVRVPVREHVPSRHARRTDMA